MNLSDEHTVPVIPQITDEVRKAAGGGGAKGRGGMASKIAAAEKTMNADVDLFIVDACKHGALGRVLTEPSKKTLQEANATLFPSQSKLTDREHWMLFSSKAAGEIKVDEGASKALLGKGGSLLPSGILKVSGAFKVGDVVRILDENGVELARGIVNHASGDVKKIKGKKSPQIRRILGGKCKCEVVYRGNMAVKVK